MAGKLSESAWSGFLEKHKLELDDKALVKALAAYDKTDDSKPQPRLKSLEEVIKQVPEQVKALTKRKKELGDKPFGLVKDELYALLDEAEALLKKTRAAIAASDGDEEPDTPVLLTTKMVPLLRELRKGEVRMHAMICTAGKNTAVLIMRRAISPSRRKLLAEAVDAKGGMKYIVGECMFENKALTFVVTSPAAQLAKRLRQALLDQTEMRIKVRVRGEGGVEDEDIEGDDGEEQTGVQPQRTPAPPRGPASAEQLAYTQRLRKVRERYEQALKQQHPESTKLRGLMAYASEKADAQKDYAAAAKALEMVEKLLGASMHAGAAFNARLAALMPGIKQTIAEAGPSAQAIKQQISEAGALAAKSQYVAAHALLDDAERALAAPMPGRVAPERKRDAQASAPAAQEAGVPFDEAAFRRQWTAAKSSWRDALDSVDAQIARLQVALRAQNDPELSQIADHGLNGVTGNFKVPLMASVMDIDAARGEALRKAARKGLRATRAFARYLSSEETVRVTDENEFGVPVTIRSSLGKALRDIDAALAPLN
jgi:hypothetical protein